jgi:ADP-heptose:LPS heptosyltransferase
LGDGKVFVGNNTGPLHLACALGTATVSVIGPTVPYRWWPLGKNHQVVNLGVFCSPCNLGWCSHHTCLRSIGVDQVFELVCNQVR